MPPNLVVTADDFGLSVARNRGVLEAHREGIVTGVSILANGPALEDALARLAEAPRLFVGLHFNLSEGRPAGRRLATLTGSDGLFPGKERARAAIRAGRVDPAEIQEELVAQVDRLARRGVRVSHLDGHQHVHVYPVAREAIASACRDLGIRTVRIPAERLSARDVVLADRRARIRQYVSLAREARAVYRRHGVASTDAFLGLGLMGRWSREALLSALDGASRARWIELMTHPGYADPDGDPFSASADRDAERRVLVDPAVGEAVRARFRLAVFGDLPWGN